MRTYYLFRVNDTFKTIYHYKNEYLYEILEQIYRSRTNEQKLLYRFFSQLVIPINKSEIKKNMYLYYDNIMIKSDNVLEMSNIYTGEETKILVGETYLKIKTNIAVPALFKNSALKMFVCDFDMKDYFWLDDTLSTCIMS